jgi:hypothetical protein
MFDYSLRVSTLFSLKRVSADRIVYLGAMPPCRDPKRLKVQAECLTETVTKLSLARILQNLNAAGYLTDIGEGTRREVCDELRASELAHSIASTPHGTVVQKMPLNDGPLKQWSYVNPHALTFYMSTLSEQWSELFLRVLRPDPTRPVRIILYIDGITPGNNLRPDKGRSMEALYWACADWPAHVLQRADCWPPFGVIRQSIVEHLPGHTSFIVRLALKAFFPTKEALDCGSLIVHRSKNEIVRWSLGGILADLDAHKYLWSIKGHNGSKPCITCQNVVNFVTDDVLAHRNDLVSMSCVDPHRIIYNTDASVYAIVDRLRAAKASGMSQAAFDRLEQVHGVVYDESTLLFDDELRHIVKPVTHCIRDHMHCLVSNGIVGTEIALLLHELADCNVTHDHIVRYADTFRMPKTRGAKPDKRWFSEPGEKNMRAFASEQLNMVPIMMCFLVDMMLPRGLLLDHVKCFLWLERIVALVSLGPDGAVPHVHRIRAAIFEHARLYVKLYGHVLRPKFHHIFHIPDNVEFLQKLMSCFVCERKHKMTKNKAREKFAHFEQAVIVSLVNQFCCHMSKNDTPYLVNFLIEPQSVALPDGREALRSIAACLECGGVHRGDIVYLASRSVVKVMSFWEGLGSEIVAQIEYYVEVDHAKNLWDTSDPSVHFVDVATIVAAIPIQQRSANVLRIVVPILYRDKGAY